MSPCDNCKWLLLREQLGKRRRRRRLRAFERRHRRAADRIAARGRRLLAASVVGVDDDGEFRCPLTTSLAVDRCSWPKGFDRLRPRFVSLDNANRLAALNANIYRAANAHSTRAVESKNFHARAEAFGDLANAAEHKPIFDLGLKTPETCTSCVVGL